jgi:acyl carrier protein
VLCFAPPRQLNRYAALMMSRILNWVGGFLLFIAVMIAIGIPIAIWTARAKKKRMEEAFEGRPPLDERTFYETYFESRGVPFFVVAKVRQILESELGADLARLSAADDFARNLSFFWDYDSGAAVEIVLRLEKEFGITIADAEAQQTTTIDDIVNLVWLKLRERAA